MGDCSFLNLFAEKLVVGTSVASLVGEINEVNGAKPILRMCLVTKTTPWPTESPSADADSVEVRCGFKSRLVEQKLVLAESELFNKGW